MLLRTLKTGLLLCVLASGVSCHSLLPKHWSRSDIQNLQGNWQSDGFGLALSIDREDLSLYNITSEGCYPEPVTLSEIAYELPFVDFISDSKVRLGDAPEGGFNFTFDRLDSIDSVCTESLGSSAVDVVKAYAGTMSNLYPFFELHNINDWSIRTQRAIDTVKSNASDETVFKALVEMINGIQDSHVGIAAQLPNGPQRISKRHLRDLDPILRPRYEAQANDSSYRRFRQEFIKELRRKTQQAVLENAPGQLLGTAADGKLIWGTHAGVGYLLIHQFARYSNTIDLDTDLAIAANAMDRVVQDLKNADAIVIDVSLARGGFASVAFGIASRFAPPAPETESKTPIQYLSHERKVYASRNPQWEPVYITASDRPTFAGAVTVITSDATTSAAEEFVLAMKAFPQVKIVGTATNGSFSDMLEKSLPNGWSIGLSHQVYRDAQGVELERQGVIPDTQLPLFQAIDQFPQTIVSIVKNSQ